MTEPIVSFDSPPVVEVVAGVAFHGVTAELGALLAAFWKDKLREHFPTLQQQPPYTAPEEKFPAVGTTPGLTFSLGDTFPVTRLWALSDDNQQILQLQPGWFACNWRKVKPAGEYDRWERRRATLERWFTSLSEYLASEGFGEPKVRQCELTYVNHILPSEAWVTHSDFSQIFTWPQPSAVQTPPLEQVAIQGQFLLGRPEAPTGRLHAKIVPAYGSDGETPVYLFELTGRGAPSGDGITGVLAFLDTARDAIVRAFVAMTTPNMHRDWGLQP